MSQNGQTHFIKSCSKCCQTFKVSDHFGTLCIKGLNLKTKHWVKYENFFWIVDIFISLFYAGRIRAFLLFNGDFQFYFPFVSQLFQCFLELMWYTLLGNTLWKCEDSIYETSLLSSCEKFPRWKIFSDNFYFGEFY